MTPKLLDILDPGERRAVIAAAVRHSYAAGQAIFLEGDSADGVHLIRTGHVAVRSSTPDGDVATLNVLGPGATFGELALLPGHPPGERSATVLALDAVTTGVLSRSSFHALCESHPGVEQLLLGLLAARIKELSADLLEARYVALEQRLVTCLVRLAEVYGENQDLVVIPLTQEHLAGLVGGARPRVNEALQGLAAVGVVALGRGKVTVLERQRLKDFKEF